MEAPAESSLPGSPLEKMMTVGVCSESAVRPWSDLVPELLELIIQLLTIKDRLVFDRVCKRWSSIVRVVPRHSGLSFGVPCQATISDDGKTCTLADPFCNHIYIKCHNLPSSCAILCSKDGWLLILHPLEEKDDTAFSIFFFNPLKNIRIDLPDIDWCCRNRAFAFSSSPISPDCIVIAVRAYYKGAADIYICQRGNSQWIELGEMFNQFPFTMGHVSPVFCNGSFYCLGDDGRLGVFKPDTNDWEVLPMPRPMQHLFSKRKELYVAEFDGEILMIFADQMGDSVLIHKLDLLKGTWEEIDTLGDKSLLVGRMSSICSKAEVLIHNGIYFPRTKDGVYMFYDCKKHKFYQSGNFALSQFFPLSFWIDLAWIHPLSEKQLKWSN